MSYIATIVDYINGQLLAGFLACDNYENKSVIGLAQQLPRAKDDKIEIIPSYVDAQGECQYVGPDDDYDLMCYHRVNSITVAKANLPSYGDAKKVDANIARMCFVVFGIRDRLGVSNDELAVNIQASFPEAATKQILQQLQFKAANININEIVLSDLQVFAEEYQNSVPFFLRPNQFLFKVNYTIESAFLKGCFINECD